MSFHSVRVNGVPVLVRANNLAILSGGVINWDNGDVTLTHSANAITIAGGDLVASNFMATASGEHRWNGRTRLFSPGDGKLDLFKSDGGGTGAQLDFSTNGTLQIKDHTGSDAALLTAHAQLLGGAAVGAATSRYTLRKKVTGIADNSATDVFTVTVPNAAHAAAIRITFLSSNGSTDAFESSRVAMGTVVIARTSGADTVAAVAALDNAQIATVGGGATHTLAYGVTGMTGASSATQTFTVQVTIDDSGNTGGNQVVAVAELINAEATGVTIA